MHFLWFPWNFRNKLQLNRIDYAIFGSAQCECHCSEHIPFFLNWNIHLNITKTAKSISRANRSHVQLQSHRRSNCWKFENNPMCHWHSKNIQLKNAKIFCRIFFSLQLACDHHRVVSLGKTYSTRCCTLYTNKT